MDGVRVRGRQSRRFWPDRSAGHTCSRRGGFRGDWAFVFSMFVAMLWSAFLPPVQAQTSPAPAAQQDAPAPFIRLRTEAEVAQTRAALIRHTWGSADLPRRRATAVEKSVTFRWPGPKFSPNTEIWRITQVMPHGVETNAFYVSRNTARSCLMIFVQGHLPELDDQKSPSVQILQRLLGGGCDVIVHAMPLLGGNNQPVVDSPKFGRITLNNHNVLKFLESETFSPMLYFFEPVAAALNAVLAERSYPFIGMTGLSGGGWTTTVYSAMDTRIALAVPIAGSTPISIRTQHAKSFGDWEQTAPRFYSIASYSDLYLMAGHGGRHIELIHIERDPCCFDGGLIGAYKTPVLQSAAGLKSSVGFTVVSGQRHEINRAAADKLLQLVAERTGLKFPTPSSPQDLCRGNSDVLLRRDLKGPFTTNGGVAWTANVPDLAKHASSMSAPQRSRLILCEDGVSIGEANAQHADVRRFGKGIYSHWDQWLIFSTTDSSNPNRNGRRYSVIIPKH